MTKLKLPIGISDFKEVIEDGYHYIDKTLFVKDVVENGSKVLLFTRPRRFGKTINMSMLNYFLTSRKEEINPSLFNKTLINEDSEFCAKYQNKYPVIFITFKGLKEDNYVDAESAIRGLVSRIYRDLSTELESSLSGIDLTTYISLKEKKSDKDDLKFSLAYLCKYYYQHTGKNIYLLIDEYDSPITAAYIHGYYNEMIDLMKNLLGEALKDNKYLAKGIVTGITRISQESIFSGFNNPDVYSMLRKDYGEYFGFTDSEVTKLLNDDAHPEQLADIKEWYNGYQVGPHTLYNPWSILNCVNQKYNYEAYWLNTSDNALIRRQLESSKATIRESFIDLLQGKKTDRAVSDSLVFPDLAHDEEAIWSLLHSSGYLNISSTHRKGRRNIATLSIPNEEVKFIYDAIVEQWFSKVSSLSNYDKFANSIASGDTYEFKQMMSAYLAESGSYFDFNKSSSEQVFHTFMLGLVVGLRDKYIISSNQESGFGRYDLTLLPKDKS